MLSVGVITLQRFQERGKWHLSTNYRNVKKHRKYLHQLEYQNLLRKNAVSVIERYVCKLYGKPKLTSVNEARLECFVGKYKENNKKPSSWPLCARELYQNILGTNLITNKWKSSHLACHSTFSPTLNGWVLENGYFLHKWYGGDEIPADIDIFSTLNGSDDISSSDEFSVCSSESESDDDEY